MKISNRNVRASRGILQRSPDYSRFDLDVASATTGMLTVKAAKTDASLLGKVSAASDSNAQDTGQAQNMDLSGLTAMARSQGVDDRATLVAQGLGAAPFYASGAHTNYGELAVDNSGRRTLQWRSDWFESRSSVPHKPAAQTPRTDLWRTC
ncbi:hypothetical protein [Rhodococcus sp. BH5]|uniref:hypothetical protein n=1 Tax=Rhodococcus sp. BH5 TaxID=2871702 RepID=UPI0022CD423E|nr:hypothetical protein [Rhodococcus sp. BH5]MCZ9635364.1 hypothetical protein [Rhodococcus sp. BH5]